MLIVVSYSMWMGEAPSCKGAKSRDVELNPSCPAHINHCGQLTGFACIAFSAPLTLLAGRQEEHPACNKSE